MEVRGSSSLHGLSETSARAIPQDYFLGKTDPLAGLPGKPSPSGKRIIALPPERRVGLPQLTAGQENSPGHRSLLAGAIQRNGGSRNPITVTTRQAGRRFPLMRRATVDRDALRRRQARLDEAGGLLGPRDAQTARLRMLDNASRNSIGFYIRLIVGGALALATRRCLRGRQCDLCTRAADDYAGCATPWPALNLPAIPELRGVPDELRQPGGSVSEFL
jgi:hypothetical protein